MCCSVTDLRSKDVINVADGSRVGCITDVEIDTVTGALVNVVVFCGKGLWGLLGRGEEVTVAWKDIVVIGDDTVLVRRGGAKPGALCK